MTNNLYLSKHKSDNGTEFVTVGFRMRSQNGEIIGYMTTVDADWFFNAVEALRVREADHIIKDESV